ncbi:prolyl oligopeptidase family serine peptidase [Hymenobacter sp. HMF4947]|uniref:Prolyl oligopeptidase family serine peptidase n=1 Tax=Hymenobacter ginkgonis TaxID=2682976 RepID=A0A7K1TGQ8_9BACT|nr:alpha/beta hydrolase [Hymenobacter ginkgonis]MVN77569.1 prolyl oligopeptidase family serine peptidase [Hymenobacter ginkgonis]
MVISKQKLLHWTSGVLVALLLAGLAWPWLNWPSTSTDYLLYSQTYFSAQRTNRPVLVVVLHGDAPFNQPSYQYMLAQRVAQAVPDVVAVGLLRPGYTDPAGHHSPGRRGTATGDNYRPREVDAIAATVQALRRGYHARRVVLAGHSGGATLTGDLLGRYPALADAALLAACPCDVPAFRQHMARQHFSPMWWRPVPFLSPQEWVDQVRPGLPVRVVTGLADPIALPTYSQRYAAALRQRHVAVELVELPSQGHEIFLTPAVMVQLKGLISGLTTQ